MFLSNIKKRICYRGGRDAIDRMIQDKNKSLKNALFNSYQSATAVLEDGREFKCLINPNKLSMELDDKMLSIPFEDVCLNKNGGQDESTNVKCGSVIQWKENGSHWIVYSQFLQEVAYFRGLMRQCESEPLEIDGKKFWYYLKGPDDKSIDWQKTKHLIFNNLNYSIELYITKDERTLQFFQKFKKCKIYGKNFEIQAVDELSVNGLLLVYLKETYSNAWEQPVESAPPESDYNPNDVYITGDFQVYPYETKVYSFGNLVGGRWQVNNKRAKILSQTDNTVTVEIITGKSGTVSLEYILNSAVYFSKEIKILSL